MAKQETVGWRLPTSVDEVEADCSHPACSEALFQEIHRVGSWNKAESICLEEEAKDDLRAWQLERDTER